MSVWGSVIGAGASLLGGLLGKSSADRARSDQKAHLQQERQFREQLALNGIQWKVADAKKAGIHPLYAMGASTPTYAPISANFKADDTSYIGRMGQHLGRAANAVASGPERKAGQAYTAQLRGLQLERAQLENTLLASRIRTATQAGTGPGRGLSGGRQGTIIPGQGDTLNIKKADREIADDHGSSEKHKTAAGAWVKTRTGLVRGWSERGRQLTEEQWGAETGATIRRNILPSVGIYGGQKPSLKLYPLPPGQDWAYHPLYQEWRPSKKTTGGHVTFNTKAKNPKFRSPRNRTAKRLLKGHPGRNVMQKRRRKMQSIWR